MGYVLSSCLMVEHADFRALARFLVRPAQSLRAVTGEMIRHGWIRLRETLSHLSQQCPHDLESVS